MFKEMVAHAVEGLPHEACGILAGQDGRPVRHYPMRNAEESTSVYRFDAQQQLDVFTELEDKGWDLLAFWHSHTHTEAFPSPTDRARAYWRDPVSGDEVPAYPGTKYLVLSLKDLEKPIIRAFRFEGSDPVEEEVRIA
jgi:[CysO sulfur-carrier protein]-S-L-cysteine hydrolase